ncbi:MAG: hypothetical protein ABI572_05210 [Actinomycetota bacterium]
MESQGGSKPTFDMASMSMATKGVLITGILLLIDSFLPWQKFCAEITGVQTFCAKWSAWNGSGGFFGLMMGIALIVLLLFEGSQLANMNMNMQLPVSRAKAAAYLGFAVVVFGLLKFLLVLTSEVSAGFGAWIGVILLAAMAYASFLYFKSDDTVVAPPPPATEL